MPSVFSPSSSVASLVPHHTGKKDFAGAFASLQSSFGFGGAAPIVESSAPKKKKVVRSNDQVPARPTSEAPGAPAPAGKDYAAAFAAMQSSYGFGGSAPYQAAASPKFSKSSKLSK
jgi:hypothetical protein